MGWLKSFFKNVVVGAGTIELFGAFFGYDDKLNDIVSDNAVLVGLGLVAYAFYTYVIWDANLHSKKRKHENRLSGASRRKKRGK